MEVDVKKDAKIMVVEDSDFSRKSIVEILEKTGFNVVGEAASAEVAAQLLSTCDPNLFIIDVVMPVVSGMEFARNLKEKYRKLAVIMISSLGQEHIVIESISAGAVDFLKKPFSADQLISSVEKAYIMQYANVEG